MSYTSEGIAGIGLNGIGLNGNGLSGNGLNGSGSDGFGFDGSGIAEVSVSLSRFLPGSVGGTTGSPGARTA